MQNLSANENTDLLPFYEQAMVINPRCERCLDTGIWLTPRKKVEPCPVLVGREWESHPGQNDAAQTVTRSVSTAKAGLRFHRLRIRTRTRFNTFLIRRSMSPGKARSLLFRRYQSQRIADRKTRKTDDRKPPQRLAAADRITEERTGRILDSYIARRLQGMG